MLGPAKKPSMEPETSVSSFSVSGCQLPTEKSLKFGSNVETANGYGSRTVFAFHMVSSFRRTLPDRRLS